MRRCAARICEFIEMEGTISTIEELYRLEAEEDAGAPDPYREARNDDIETFLYSRALRNAQQRWPRARRSVNT